MMHQFSSVQFSSVAQSCPTLCDLMNHSTSGLPVHHQLTCSDNFPFLIFFVPLYECTTTDSPVLLLNGNLGCFRFLFVVAVIHTHTQTIKVTEWEDEYTVPISSGIYHLSIMLNSSINSSLSYTTNFTLPTDYAIIIHIYCILSHFKTTMFFVFETSHLLAQTDTAPLFWFLLQKISKSHLYSLFSIFFSKFIFWPRLVSLFQWNWISFSL